MQQLGIVGGIGPGSTAAYYRAGLAIGRELHARAAVARLIAA